MGSYDSLEAVKALSDPDPEFQALWAKLPTRPDAPRPAPAIMRPHSDALEDTTYNKTSILDTTECTVEISMRDGFNHELRIVRPPASPTATPLILLIHGGGFMVGTTKQLIPFARLFASIYNVTVVLGTYRLGPEYKFPIAARDIWDTTMWLREHAHCPLIHADVSRGFVVGGVSAGANLASVTVHRAVKEYPGLVTGSWSSVPGFLLDDSVLPEVYKEFWISREQNINAPILNGKDMESIEGNYGAEQTVEYCPFVDPESFRHMPRTYIQVCGLDPLRDDGLIYERVLRQHGVETRLDAYAGVPHGHWAGFPGLKVSGKAVADAVREMGWLLGVEVDEGMLEGAVREMGFGAQGL
ncbi:Alpha/Beta hydrolase protein [Aspergillus undulatus]|uniref:Alpha/Beta hydrolase protein n=1 Tax=Aspergillus undulatus TaxID=1810928 RepID=UPI003CCE1FA3